MKYKKRNKVLRRAILIFSEIGWLLRSLCAEVAASNLNAPNGSHVSAKMKTRRGRCQTLLHV